MYEDKTIMCVDCQKEFQFTVAEQEFYAEKGFQNEPVRCKPCRDEKKKKFKKSYKVQCASCGVETDVPFKPTGIKPVLCRQCYTAQKND